MQVLRSRMRSNAKIHCQNFSGSLQMWDMAEEFVQGLKLGFSLSKDWLL